MWMGREAWSVLKLGCSYLFMLMEPEWDLWISFYFLFTSVALVGFGDVFPRFDFFIHRPWPVQWAG